MSKKGEVKLIRLFQKIMQQSDAQISELLSHIPTQKFPKFLNVRLQIILIQLFS